MAHHQRVAFSDGVTLTTVRPPGAVGHDGKPGATGAGGGGGKASGESWDWIAITATKDSSMKAEAMSRLKKPGTAAGAFVIRSSKDTKAVAALRCTFRRHAAVGF